MSKNIFQSTVLKYLLALLIVSIVASFIQDGNPIQDPNGFMGIIGTFILLLLVLISITNILVKSKQKKEKKPKKKRRKA